MIAPLPEAAHGLSVFYLRMMQRALQASVAPPEGPPSNTSHFLVRGDGLVVCPRLSYPLEARICRRGEDPGFHENGVDWDVDGALHEWRHCCFCEARGGRSCAALAILIEGSVFFVSHGFDYRVRRSFIQKRQADRRNMRIMKENVNVHNGSEACGV